MSFSDTLNAWLQTSPVFSGAEKSTIKSKNTPKTLKAAAEAQQTAAVKGSSVVTSWGKAHLTEIVFILLGLSLVVGGIFVFKNSTQPIVVSMVK